MSTVDESATVTREPGAKPALRGGRLPWRLILVLCALAALSLLVDGRVTEVLTGESVGTWLAERIAQLGFLFALLNLLAILYSYPNGRRVCVGFLAPLVVHFPLLHLLKWAVGRARPLADQGPFEFAPFSGETYYDSFPSGHAAMVGVVALTLGIYFPRARWVFYIWAAAIGLERIVSDWHFLSDVFAGYALAVLVVFATVCWLGPHFYKTDSPEPREKS